MTQDALAFELGVNQQKIFILRNWKNKTGCFIFAKIGKLYFQK